MKASTVIAIAAGLATASAQLADIPQCALSCAISSIGSSGCGTTDIACICKASGFISALTPCVEKACSAADLAKTIQAATGLCASAGVSLVIPSATASSAAATASSAAGASTTSAAVITTTTAAYVSSSTLTTSTAVVVSSVYVAPNATTTTTSPSTPSSNSTVTTGSPSGTSSSLPSASPTGNAAGRNAVAMTGLGAVLAFAAALL